MMNETLKQSNESMFMRARVGNLTFEGIDPLFFIWGILGEILERQSMQVFPTIGLVGFIRGMSPLNMMVPTRCTPVKTTSTRLGRFKHGRIAQTCQICTPLLVMDCMAVPESFSLKTGTKP